MGESLDDGLTQSLLLGSLSPSQLDRVRARSQRVRLAEGAWLFSQGDSAERFFFVRSGQIRLFLLSPEGDEKIIELIGPGQTFAEALMFMGTGCYPVCAAALSDTELVAIDANDFAAMLRESPETCFTLLGGLSQRLHALIAEIDSLTLHSASGRVARWLLAQLGAGKRELSLDVRKSVLASRLSIKPETWSRITRRLSDGGVIRVEGQRIEILDLEALRRLSEDGLPEEG